MFKKGSAFKNYEDQESAISYRCNREVLVSLRIYDWMNWNGNILKKKDELVKAKGGSKSLVTETIGKISIWGMINAAWFNKIFTDRHTELILWYFWLNCWITCKFMIIIYWIKANRFFKSKKFWGRGRLIGLEYRS